MVHELQLPLSKINPTIGSQDLLIYWDILQHWGRDWVWYSHQYRCEDRTRRPMLEGQSAAYAEQILSAASDWAFWLVETVMANFRSSKILSAIAFEHYPANVFSPSRQILNKLMLSSNIHGTIKLCSQQLYSIVLLKSNPFFLILHSFSIIFPRLYIDFALTSPKGYCHQRGRISEMLVREFHPL